MEKRKRLLALLLIPAILLALSACGKESRPTVPSDATKAPEESSAPADGSDPTQPIVPDIDLAGQWVKPNAEQECVGWMLRFAPLMWRMYSLIAPTQDGVFT